MGTNFLRDYIGTCPRISLDNLWKRGFTLAKRRSIGHTINQVDEFTYHHSETTSPENDANLQSAKDWSALNKQNVVWKSNLLDINKNFFTATVKSNLLYGTMDWILTNFFF